MNQILRCFHNFFSPWYGSSNLENKRKIWFCFSFWDFQLRSQMKSFSQLCSTKKLEFLKVFIFTNNWANSFNSTAQCFFYFNRNSLLLVKKLYLFQIVHDASFLNDKITKSLKNYKNYTIIILNIILYWEDSTYLFYLVLIISRIISLYLDHKEVNTVSINCKYF